MNGEIVRQCRRCGATFLWSVGEQIFFARRGLGGSAPTYCQSGQSTLFRKLARRPNKARGRGLRPLWVYAGAAACGSGAVVRPTQSSGHTCCLSTSPFLGRCRRAGLVNEGAHEWATPSDGCFCLR